MQIISEAAFIERFLPERNPDGSYYLQRDWTVPDDLAMIADARETNRLWTFVNDGAGNGGIVQGFAFVNREFYIITAVAHDDGDDIEILTDVDFCTVCGERFSDTLDLGGDEDEVVERSGRDDTVCVICASA